jgi:hypothetical protein
MQKTKVAHTVEPLDHPGMPRVVEIEEQVAVGREAVGEEHFARAEVVLRVMGPEPLLTNWRRGDDGAVAIAVPREIDDRDEVAVDAVLVANQVKR